jgi:hypothetical protein
VLKKSIGIAVGVGVMEGVEVLLGVAVMDGVEVLSGIVPQADTSNSSSGKARNGLRHLGSMFPPCDEFHSSLIAVYRLCRLQ